LDDVGELAAILALVVVEPHQARLHDVDAGDVFWNGESIGIFFGEALKVLDDIEQIARRRVTRLWGRRARRATGE